MRAKMDEDVRRMVKTTDATKKKLPSEHLKSVFLPYCGRSGEEGGKGGASENSGKRKGRPLFGGPVREEEWRMGRNKESKRCTWRCVEERRPSRRANDIPSNKPHPLGRATRQTPLSEGAEQSVGPFQGTRGHVVGRRGPKPRIA